MSRRVDQSNPLNPDFSPNRWLLARYLSLPCANGGDRLAELRGVNHAAITGAPPWNGVTRPGALGRTLLLNGVSHYATSARSVSLGTTFTISAWVRLDNAGSFPMILTTSDSVMDFRFSSTSAKLQFGGSTVAANALTLGKWYHAVAVCEGTASRIYQDGVLVASATDGLSKAGTIAIGRRSDGFYLAGSIDDVCVFRKPLNIAEIRQVRLDSAAGSPDSLRWQEDRAWKASAAAVSSLLLRRRRMAA